MSVRVIVPEDETGYNLIVWSNLVDSQRNELLGSCLLGVTGEMQRDGEVVVHVLRPQA